MILALNIHWKVESAGFDTLEEALEYCKKYPTPEDHHLIVESTVENYFYNEGSVEDIKPLALVLRGGQKIVYFPEA